MPLLSRSSSSQAVIRKLSLEELPTVSITTAEVDEIANAIIISSSNGNNGILIIKDLPIPPFDRILDLLQPSSTTTKRINDVFKHQDLQVYNDNYKGREGGGSRRSSSTTSTTSDRKISLDLSLDRLETIQKVDPSLLNDLNLQQAMEFYKHYQSIIQTKLCVGFAKAIGMHSQQQIEEFVNEDLTFNYRMIDYNYPLNEEEDDVNVNNDVSNNNKEKKKIWRHNNKRRQLHSCPSQRPSPSQRPRLKEHRDFGFMTLIQATSGGLQIKSESTGKWIELPLVPPGTAILMYGWCGQIKSNGRLPAVLHRINDLLPTSCCGGGHNNNNNDQYHDQHRISAVLFVNPKRVDTSLDYATTAATATTTTTSSSSCSSSNSSKNEEECRILYRQGITAGQLNKVLMESKSEKTIFDWLVQKEQQKNHHMKKEGDDDNKNRKKNHRNRRKQNRKKQKETATTNKSTTTTNASGSGSSGRRLFNSSSSSWMGWFLFRRK